MCHIGVLLSDVSCKIAGLVRSCKGLIALRAGCDMDMGAVVTW
jgi:hypothetical protein